MNNGQKSLSINETFIIESIESSDVMSACTGFYTNALISCTGNTQILLSNNIIKANSAFSATTFYGDGSNLTGISTQDTFVTGGTYNSNSGIATFTNNTGGTFSVTGFYTGATDVYVTGVTFTNNLLTLRRNDGVSFGATIDNFVSLNVNGPISATTYYGDGSNLTGISTQDTFVTGGTYSAGTAVFTNNTGGTFNVTGFTTGTTTSQNLQEVTDGVGNNITTNDIIVTGATGTDILISSQFDSSQIYVTDGTASVTLAAQNGSTTSESLIQLTSDTGYGLIYPTGAQFSEVTGGVANISPDMLELSSVANPMIRLATSSGDTSIKTDLITTSNLEQQLPDKSGTFAMLSDLTNVVNLVTVGLTGSTGVDFNSIKEAVDSITGSSSNNRFLVSVGPGRFSEGEIDLSQKPYISIKGSDLLTTEIVPNTNTQHIFKIGQNNELSFLSLSGAPSGYAGIYVYDTGIYSLAHKLSFIDCDTNVWVESHTQYTSFYGEYLDFNGEYSYGTKTIAYNGYVALTNIENYYNFPTGTGTTIGNHVQGSGATLSVFVGDGIGNGASGSTNYQISDYASLNTMSTTCYNWGYAVRVLNNGGPSRFDIDSLSIVDSLVWDLSIEHPNTFGTFGGGSSSHAKINNLSNDVYWAFLDIEDGEFDITRKISITFQDDTHTDASTLIFEGSTMGLIDGGVITHVSGLTFEVSSGFGYLKKTIGNGIYMRIDWLPTQITLLPDDEVYLYFNENEILSSSGSAPDSINNIILGRVVTDSSTVRFIDSSPYIGTHTSNLFSNFNRSALGPIYSTGSIVTENVTPYHLNISSGDYYYSENNFKPSGGTDVSFVQYYRDNLTGWTTTGTTEVVNGYDDNSGTISPLPLSSFTKHSLYVVGEGVNETYMLVLGQVTYSTLVEAEGADLPTPPTYFDDSVTPIASILIQQGMSGITEIQDIRPVIGFKAAGVSASAVHANLLGLSADDHTQYLLVDGDRAMSGNLSMGGNAIFSALTYNGVTIESHASRHKNGGADEIASATPAPSEIPKADTFGKLDGWISDASTTVKGLTRLSVNPLSAATPIAVGVNDPRFLNSISGVTNTTPSLVFTNNSGGTTTISNLRMSGLTATTISATTYQNLPIDIRVTGATYSASTGITTFRNNTGGTFTVTGYFTPSNDIYVSGGTVDHGPSDNADNLLLLNRSDLTNVTISNLVNISNTTKSDIDSLIASKWIIRGKTYKISGCDSGLYDNGINGKDARVYTSIYLMGLENNRLSETGIGEFYTPKYSDFSIFVDGNSYSQDQRVIWGGYVWSCIQIGTYTSIDIFTLDPNGFEILYPFNSSDAYNTSLYNIQYDDIIYDYTNDKIIYRNEQNSNIVSTTYENINYWVNEMSLYNPIKAFKWGNLFTDDDRGIGNQTIVNSYNENINYTGRYQINLHFENHSYQIKIISDVDEGNYQDGIILENYSYIDTISLRRSSSYQSNIKLSNNSYISNIILDRVAYQNEIILDNNSYINDIDMSSADSAYQSRIFLSNNSYISNGIFNVGSYQTNFVFNNGSYMDTFELAGDCSQQNFNFNNLSYQSSCTLVVGVDQEFIYMDNGSQSNGFSETQTNITVKGYDIDWSSYPSISPQTDLYFIHNLVSDDTAPVYIGKINNRLVEVTKPIDIFVTGGTYDSGTNTATFTNNSGGTFNVTGFSSGGGGSFTGGTVSGPTTFTNGLTANTISATTIVSPSISTYGLIVATSVGYQNMF